MPISTTLTQRAIAALSTRSASVPDTPENRKNGAMNSAAPATSGHAACRRVDAGLAPARPKVT